MREDELCELERTRVQVGRVARIRAKCDEIAPKGSYRSPSLTGMPGGGGEPCGLDGSKKACEALLCELEREEGKLARMLERCERILGRQDMKAEMKAFCRAYYLRRMSVARAAERAGVAERTGWNYKSEIESFRRLKKIDRTRKKRAKIP